MCGICSEYTDTYAIKNTINFFGLVTLCVGRILPEEGDIIQVKEDRSQYRRAILKEGKVEGVLLQGNIANAGVWQYLIKNRIDVNKIQKDIFDINFADFYSVDAKGRYIWTS